MGKKPPKSKSDEQEKVEVKVPKKEEKKREIVGGNEGMIRFDGKLKRLFAELEKLKKERPSDKSLIFTSFSKSLNWICDSLTSKGFKFKTLTGSMTMNKRK